jgi:2,3,4,5-tetrahydropyridine-2,6-dicarboxylate N-succinyltransferase
LSHPAATSHLSSPLEERINLLSQLQNPERTDENLRLLEEFRLALNRGEIRAAEPVANEWRVNLWVKKGLLLHLWLGQAREMAGGGAMPGFDLDTLPVRRLTLEDRIRIAPGGSCIRDGAFLAPGVTCMSPVFVNIGVYVGEKTVLDSNVMVGPCAQIGAGVHIGPGTQIGGVIRPLEHLPSTIGDDAIIGGNCGLYDGTAVGAGAVLASGTVLSGFSRIYDPLRKTEYRRTESGPLRVPPGAIVVPGLRLSSEDPATTLLGAIVVGYRDNEGGGEKIQELRL